MHEKAQKRLFKAMAEIAPKKARVFAVLASQQPEVFYAGIDYHSAVQVHISPKEVNQARYLSVMLRSMLGSLEPKFCPRCLGPVGKSVQVSDAPERVGHAAPIYNCSVCRSWWTMM